MANRFYTILVVPEKTSQVRRIIVPSWIARGFLVGVFFAVAIGTIMLLDYWYVMNQISENKQLKMENRRLRQQVQIFKNKMSTIESTMERVKTFSTRLKVITNIEDRDGLIQSLNQKKIPDAATNVGLTTESDRPISSSSGNTDDSPQPHPASYGSDIDAGLANRVFTIDEALETPSFRKEHQELETRFTQLHEETLLVEQVLQDQYELLADQKSFLAALPTRKPAIGYFTSGFGIRRSPIGNRIKMHEGLDIANHPGTPIRAPADGFVVHAATKPGYGLTLILDHGYGLETWYGHTRKIIVRNGEKVRRGQIVAQLGNSGRSTGPHLHYEVRVHGTPVDPLSYILEN